MRLVDCIRVSIHRHAVLRKSEWVMSECADGLAVFLPPVVRMIDWEKGCVVESSIIISTCWRIFWLFVERTRLRVVLRINSASTPEVKHFSLRF